MDLDLIWARQHPTEPVGLKGQLGLAIGVIYQVLGFRVWGDIGIMEKKMETIGIVGIRIGARPGHKGIYIYI